MSRALKYLLLIVFLIPALGYSQTNSGVNVNNNSVTGGLIPIDGEFNVKFKNGFDSEFYTRMNTKSGVRYLEVTFENSQIDAPAKVIYEYLVSNNKDTNFFISEESPFRGYNKNNDLIFEMAKWDTVNLYPVTHNGVERITRLEIPIYFKPQSEGFIKGIIIVNSPFSTGNIIETGYVNVNGISYVPKIDVSNFTFESQRINSGISKQKGVIKIDSELLTGEDDSSDAEINIKSLKIDPNSPDKELFSSFKILDSEYEYEEFNNKIITTGEIFNVEFELNTDLATTTGTKFARLVVVSDAAPADENGELQYVENSYLHEFDGEFYKDNPSALANGGYIQVEILENPQSNVEELTDEDVKILNSQPINGNQLNLDLPNYLNKTITLSDIEGNILRTVEANGSQKSIDISDLSSGAYFINISDGKSQVTKKFMIER